MLPQRLREVRTEKGMTQEEIADYLGFSRPTYTAYESGRRKPDQDTLVKIARYLNVSSDYLLGLSNIRSTSTPSPTLDEELTQIMRDLGPGVTLQFYDLKGMTEDEKENLKIFLEGLKARRQQKNS